MEKLIFGDSKSIELRDKAKYDNFKRDEIPKLIEKVKCRFCGGKVSNAFEVDLDNKTIGWNFDCKKTCVNSFEYAEEHGYDQAELYTNLNGKNINNDLEVY